MTQYEYKVVSAPERGVKAKGVKTPEGRFARTIEDVLNEMASEGWEYQRAETLPSTERSGLTSSTTKWRNLLVFRRPIDTASAPAQDEVKSITDAREEEQIEPTEVTHHNDITEDAPETNTSRDHIGQSS